MVSIIKTLADDPFIKPDPPQPIAENDPSQKYIQTKELEKTIFRIWNLL